VGAEKGTTTAITDTNRSILTMQISNANTVDYFSNK
jgi:hypothetical protein